MIPKLVKDYQKNKSKKEYLVLSMVKKYPLYSVNKLAEELPGISRHSIQRILEKNNLSTAEQRLDFAEENKGKFLSIFKKIKTGIFDFLKEFSFEGAKNFFERKPRFNWSLLRNLVILLILVLISWQGISFVLAKPPEITLEQPPVGFINQGEKLFVIGRVIPPGSRVTVNGNGVSLNGDGSFTAVVPIPVGESILKVEAVSKRKKAQVLRMASRTLTEAEQQTQEERQAEKRKEAMDEAAAIDRKVKDLLAAKGANAGQKQGILRVLNSQINQQSGFSSVVGEVFNQGEAEVSWVMITARFYDPAGREIDTKYGFATDFGEVIKPGQIAKFETQATQKEFDHYSLEVSWEEPTVAGVAAEGEEKATASAQNTP